MDLLRPFVNSTFALQEVKVRTTQKPCAHMSSIAALRAEVHAAKDMMYASRGHEDAVRLQALIDEKRKSEEVLQRKDKERVLRRSRVCRAFYEEIFSQQRVQFNAECRQSVELSKHIAREHRAARREAQQLAEFELSSSYAESRRRLKSACDSRHESWATMVEQHRRRVVDAREAHDSHVEQNARHLRSAELRALESSANIASKLDDVRCEEEAAALEAYNAALHEQQLFRQRQAAEARAETSRQHAQRRAMRDFGRTLRDTRELQRAVDKLAWKEQLSRQQIVHVHFQLFSGLSREFAAAHKHLNPTSAAAPQKRAGGDAAQQLAALPAVNRSAERAAARRARELAADSATQRRHESAQHQREMRLRAILAHVKAEGERVNKLRVQTLERRRGEKAATECEPFMVPEGLSSVSEVLPDSARDHVLSIVRDISF